MKISPTTLLVFLIVLCGIQINAQAQNTPMVPSDSAINYYQKTRPTSDIPRDDATVMEGKQLFEAQCSRCHEFGKQKIGPSLASATDRRPLSWLLAWVHDSQKVIESGDEYANFLYSSYNNYEMPSFEFLSEDQVLTILAYVQRASAAPNHVAGVSSGESSSDQ